VSDLYALACVHVHGRFFGAVSSRGYMYAERTNLTMQGAQGVQNYMFNMYMHIHSYMYARWVFMTIECQLIEK
jgi:hypothetical protein